MSRTVLKIKLAGGTDRLEEVAELCRRARNEAVEDWLLRSRGMTPAAKQRDGLSESTKLYHAVTAAAPRLDTQIASKLAGEIARYLSAKVDWRKQGDGKTTRRKDAVLAHEQRPPFSQALSIPVHNKQATLVYGPQSTLTVKLLRAPAWSARLQLATTNLSPAIRSKLIDISSGDRKLQDSAIHFKDTKRSWYWHLTLDDEPAAEQVNPDTVIDLYPTIPSDSDDPRKDRPLYVANGNHWYIGQGRFVLSQLHRINAAEKEIGWVYRNRRTGAGHGRKKRDQAIRLKRVQRRHVLEEFRRRLICDVMRQCQRAGAGTLVWHRPSLPLRNRSWFEKHGMDWDWTRFEADLKNQCGRRGVLFKPEIFKLKDAEK